MSVVVVQLEGSIGTDFSGIKKLFEFYHFCNDYTNTDISVDFYNLTWIDANLCSLFEAMLYKLSNDNKLNFSTDFLFLKERFDILFRNGFIKGDLAIVDNRKSSVRSQYFQRDAKEKFYKYIKEDLMDHLGMPKMDKKYYNRIVDDLIEIFTNYNYHSNTTLPFFAAGQYYPRNSQLKFTMVDLGDGFLKKINQVNAEIRTHSEAIQWALKGNSTKILEGGIGGIGISSIFNYCKENKGQLDIVTGSHYWSSTYLNTVFTFGRPLSDRVFAGSLINLTFQH
jgi:hypothetical protein